MKIKMVEQTKQGKVNPLSLECLIFVLVFIIAQSAQSVFLAIPMAYELVSNENIAIIMRRFEGSFVGFFEAVSDLTNEILSAPSVMLTMLFSTVFVIAAVIIYCKILQKRSVASLGIVKKRSISNYLIGIFLGLAFASVVYGILYLIGDVKEVKFNGFSFLLPLYLIGFVIQSASEEIMFRGYLMNSMAAKKSIGLAVVLNSIIFTAVHILNPGITLLSLLDIFIFGVIFSILCVLTDNIWMACGMHFSWNFALGCIFGGNVSGMGISSIFTLVLDENGIFTGGTFGVEDSIISVNIGLIFMLLLIGIWLVKRRKNEQ